MSKNDMFHYVFGKNATPINRIKFGSWMKKKDRITPENAKTILDAIQDPDMRYAVDDLEKQIINGDSRITHAPAIHDGNTFGNLNTYHNGTHALVRHMIAYAYPTYRMADPDSTCGFAFEKTA